MSDNLEIGLQTVYQIRIIYNQFIYLKFYVRLEQRLNRALPFRLIYV